MKNKNLFFILIILIGNGFASPAKALNVVTQTLKEAPVYESPDANAKILGKYKKATSIRVETPSRNGWYKILFSSPVRNSNFGWVRADDVMSPGSVGGDAWSTKGTKQSVSNMSVLGNNWISAGAAFFQFTPTEYQAQLVDPATSISHLGYSLEYGYRLKPKWLVMLEAQHLKYQLSRTSDTSLFYGASGFLFNLEGFYQLFGGRSFEALMGGGIGGAWFTVTNENPVSGDVKEIQNMNLITPAFFMRLLLRKELFSGVSLYGEGGYRLLSFSSVTVLKSGGTEVEVNLSMSGVFFGGGLTFLF